LNRVLRVLRVLAVLMVLTVRATAQGLPQRDTRPTATAPAGVIAGAVMTDEAQPRPLRRARVTVAGGGLTAPRTAITGDDGAFRIDRLPAGRLTVTAAKEGFITLNYGATRAGRPGIPVSLAPEQSVRLNVRLPRGAVITGTVTDIDGQPAHGISVTALASRFFGPTGERRNMAVGTSAGTTDDRGVYRIYGLPAGEYAISAQMGRTQVNPVGGEVRMLAGNAPSPTRLALAQVFHPSVTEIGRASRIAVRAGEERAGIDVQLQYVPLATISGTVTAPPGVGQGSIILVRADDVTGFDSTRVTRADSEGRFSLASVPPGQYRLIVRGAGVPAARETPAPAHYALLDIAVNGEDISNVAIVLQPGLTISGQVVFEGETPAVALPVTLRVPIPTSMPMASGGLTLPAVQVEGDRFTLAGIIPGSYRLPGIMRGINSPVGNWWLKSLVVDGRDILDAPLDIRQATDSAVATFTDRVSGVSGAVTDATGALVEGVHVVAVPVDRAFWFYGSRRVGAMRSSREGRYSVMNLPPGQYRVAAAPDLEGGEWYDPEVLERLLLTGTPLIIDGPVRKTIDLQIK
jgi:hypothetical protein